MQVSCEKGRDSETQEGLPQHINVVCGCVEWVWVGKERETEGIKRGGGDGRRRHGGSIAKTKQGN